MIDIWMIFTMMFLFFEVSLEVCKEVLTKETRKGEKCSDIVLVKGVKVQPVGGSKLPLGVEWSQTK